MQGNHWNQMYHQHPPFYGQQQAQPAPYPPQAAGSAIPSGQEVPGVQAGQMQHGQLPIQQSYIENILRLNRGKVASIYTTFENNEKWNAKVFKGVIEAAGRDHIIVSDPQSGKRYLILMVYVDYVTFDEEIEYSYPFNGELDTYSPR